VIDKLVSALKKKRNCEIILFLPDLTSHYAFGYKGI
jgi:hypothetical protein